MLSEDSINKLVQPIIDRQEQINIYVIRKIAKRVKEIGYLLPLDVKQLETLYRTGADIKEINLELARLTSLQVNDIKSLIRTVAEDTYFMAKPFYDYRHKPFIPYEKNTYLQHVVTAMAKQTTDTYKNLSKATGFMLRDRRNPDKLIPTPLAKAYQDVVDEAVQSVQFGTVDYNTAMRRTMKQLVESGVRSIQYQSESGKKYTQRLDTAVRRNILDAVKQINIAVEQEVGKQFGSDGVELSVHQFPAPDHEHVQGHQFTNEEFEKMQNGEPCKDVQGRTYAGFDRQIGQYNCRHYVFSIIVGHAKQNYTDEQLQNIIARNEKGHTFKNGKHLTMYECLQKQRQMETDIRRLKDGQIMAREMGDMDLAREYQAKINIAQRKYSAFSGVCGLQEEKNNLTVSGYRKITTR